jgi:FkbM family methyltransferase
MIETYSQAGQDLWVLKTLDNKKNGFFLDVGAYDGLKYSNSYLLEKNFNWGGLMIEAHPCNYDSLKNNRSSIMAPYAISDINEKILFENNCGTGSKITNSNGIVVESITFEKLFELYDVPEIIDYMSLDIEGYEFKALTKFPFNKYKCKTITVEHNLYLDGSENKKKIKEILINNGYSLIVENVEHNGYPFEDWYINNNL